MKYYCKFCDQAEMNRKDIRDHLKKKHGIKGGKKMTEGGAIKTPISDSYIQK